MALLLVLAAIVLVLLAVGGSLTALRLSRQAVQLRAQDDHLAQGLAAGEQIAIAWLRANAREVVLPLEGGGITVLDDRLEVAHGGVAIQVRLFDELGMIPAHLLHTTGPLRGALPPGWSGLIVPQVARERLEHPSDLLETIPLLGRQRFPRASPARAWIWRDGAVAVRAPPPLVGVTSTRDLSLAEVAGFRSHPRLNVNTAPEPLLRAAGAFLEVGKSTVDEWCTRRRKGQFTGAPAGISHERAHPLLMVESSDAWNALVTVECDGIRRAWWVMIAGNARTFWIVQRHDASR